MKITAWHFMESRDGAPVLRDGRLAPAVGEWLVHEGPIQICDSGLHASVNALDALRFAPGPLVARVECDEVERELDDKFVCRRRKILWLADATPVLHWFARRCALDVIHLWDAPDVVVRYLRAGDESLRAAACDAARAARAAARAARAAARAARAAAWDAARDAVRDVAWDAACDAARAAAWDVVRDVAWHAAWHAAWCVAMEAARAKQSRRLRRGLMTLAR